MPENSRPALKAAVLEKPPQAASALRPVAIRNSEETHMQVQVNTDHNIEGSERFDDYVRSTVEASLGRFGEQITRVEVHLSDDNGEKSNGDDKRCLVEARPAGMQPVVVTHVAATLDDAIDGAVERMERLLDGTFSKLHNPKGRTPLGEAPSV